MENGTSFSFVMSDYGVTDLKLDILVFSSCLLTVVFESVTAGGL